MQTINARYTETYDLNTALNELSMLAIHTPQSGALLRMFHGFFEQYKKYKINSCSIRMVCASQQQLTPDLVGLQAGQVDPRDVLNPILFKACTGESMNVLLDQIYNASQALPATLGSNSIDQHVQGGIATQVYYQLLADETFRKSHPQAGLSIDNLKPMVHKIVTTQPFKWNGIKGTSGYGNDSNPANIGAIDLNTPYGPVGTGSPSGSNIENELAVNPTIFVSNGITEMPWLDTAVSRMVSRYDYDESGETENLIPNQNKVLANAVINNVPRVYMGCIILPPAILQPLYFRLQISWSVSFRDWRPSQDVGTLRNYDYVIVDNKDASGQSLASRNINDSTYWNCYHQPSAKAELPTGEVGKETSSFTTNEHAEVDQIMESGN